MKRRDQGTVAMKRLLLASQLRRVRRSRHILALVGQSSPSSRWPQGPLATSDREPSAQRQDGREARVDLGKPIGRRTMLSILGLGALGVLFGQGVQKAISSALRAAGGSSVSAVLPGGGGFVIYTVTEGYPAAPPNFKVEVDGLVDRPLSLSVAELEGLPKTSLTRNFQCVTGWSVEDVAWVGVRLIDLAQHAGVQDRASAFHFSSFDRVYTESLTVEQARQSGALVAYSMLGEPITREHGGPVRLYVPAMFGYKSIKWLSKITLTDHASPGFWETRGYPINAWIEGHAPRSSA
jgi:hypothetical protein